MLWNLTSSIPITDCRFLWFEKLWYTAWGVSGFIGPVIAAIAVDTTGNYNLAYFYSAIIMGIAFVFSVLTKNPAVKPEGSVGKEENEMLNTKVTA